MSTHILFIVVVVIVVVTLLGNIIVHQRIRLLLHV